MIFNRFVQNCSNADVMVFENRMHAINSLYKEIEYLEKKQCKSVKECIELLELKAQLKHNLKERFRENNRRI